MPTEAKEESCKSEGMLQIKRNISIEGIGTHKSKKSASLNDAFCFTCGKGRDDRCCNKCNNVL